MSIFDNLSTWFQTTETDVVNLIAQIKADIPVVEANVHAALSWVAAQEPAIVQALQVTLGLAQAVGVVTVPELAAANAAVAALNAFAAAQKASAAAGTSNLTTDAQSVVAGYVAYQNANAAVSAAKATAAATAQTPTPVSA